MTDKELIASIQQGGKQQEKAIKKLFHTHRHWVKKGISKYRLTEEESLDAYADAVITIRNQILEQNFRGESKVSTYLYTVFSRRCVDRVRKNTTQPVYEQFPEIIHDQVADPQEQLIIKDSVASLLEMMDQLSEQCRQILLYRYYYGYEDMDEIAQMVGLKNANTAGSMRYRCMKRLLAIIKKSND